MLKITPQFSHVASTLFSFRMNDAILETYNITSPHLIIKAGEASVHCTIFMISGFRSHESPVHDIVCQQTRIRSKIMLSVK